MPLLLTIPRFGHFVVHLPYKICYLTVHLKTLTFFYDPRRMETLIRFLDLLYDAILMGSI